jgi:hypothetical protein
MHHRPAFGTERAVATYTMGERLGLEREPDHAAMAIAFVWLHYHFSCISCLCLAFESKMGFTAFLLNKFELRTFPLSIC